MTRSAIDMNMEEDMTEPLIFTVEGLLAAHAAAEAAGDRDTAKSLVDMGARWAIDADLDAEFAHQGIYWDAPDKAEVSAADDVSRRAKAELDLLLAFPAIKAAFETELQGQHYQAMRHERTREPALSDEDA